VSAGGEVAHNLSCNLWFFPRQLVSAFAFAVKQFVVSSLLGGSAVALCPDAALQYNQPWADGYSGMLS
jgi:hypothetical protein